MRYIKSYKLVTEGKKNINDKKNLLKSYEAGFNKIIKDNNIDVGEFDDIIVDFKDEISDLIVSFEKSYDIAYLPTQYTEAAGGSALTDVESIPLEVKVDLASIIKTRLREEGVSQEDRNKLTGTRENPIITSATKADYESLLKSYKESKQKQLADFEEGGKEEGKFIPEKGIFISSDVSFYDNKIKAVEDLLGKAPTQYTEAATPAKKESEGVSGSALKDVEVNVSKIADEYLYHGTGEGAFRRIREEGLVPQGDKYLYFADIEQYAKTYAQRKGNSFGDRILRVKKSDAYLPDENTTGGDFKIKNKINPNDIEIKQNGKWVKIQEFSDENIGIMPIPKAPTQYTEAATPAKK